MNPDVTVVIPTANRPHYLPRAVDSALAGMDPGDIEVIIIPNGPDQSWRQALHPYKNNPSVRTFTIVDGNANTARNKGLTEAKGQYIRFLDDDDFLFPESAKKQYELIQSSGADVVSGDVQLVGKDGRCFDIWKQPSLNDFCAAMLGPLRVCLPVAHVYRRSILGDAKWNPETLGRQDVEWVFDLCAARELRWKKLNEAVGAWQHHFGKRISSSQGFKIIRNKLTVPMLMRTYESLKKQGRINEIRQRATATGLWDFVHGAFYLDPKYWYSIARRARQIDATAKPIQAVYHLPVLRHLNPLLIQWILMPKRWIKFQIKESIRRMQCHRSL